jgi:transcriptional regulator with XRE-family HTH domain
VEQALISRYESGQQTPPEETVKRIAKAVTQLHTDAAGNPEVLPLEDPAHVDDFLKELKLPPLSEYLATASKYLYDNKPIKIPQGDQ